MKANQIFNAAISLYIIALLSNIYDVYLAAINRSMFATVQTITLTGITLTIYPAFDDFLYDLAGLVLIFILIFALGMAWKLDPIKGKGRKYRWAAMILGFIAIIPNLTDVFPSILSIFPNPSLFYWKADSGADLVAVITILLGWVLAEVWFASVGAGVPKGYGYADIIARNPRLRLINRIINVVVPLGVFSTFWLITYILTWNLIHTPGYVLSSTSFAGTRAITLFYIIWYPFVIVYSSIAIRDVYMSIKGSWEDVRKLNAPILGEPSITKGRPPVPPNVDIYKTYKINEKLYDKLLPPSEPGTNK